MAVLSVPPVLQFFDDSGNPLAGGKIFTYAAGTTTPLATYTDASGSTPATNPIILDAGGYPPASNGNSIWISGSYKFVVQSADGSFTKTTDNVTSFAGITSSIQAAAFIPTGSSIPADGLYKPSPTTIGFSVTNFPVASLDNNGVLSVSGGITTGFGIKPGNNAVADVNTLDWYQEGNFTPVLVGGTVPGTGTYSLQFGKYTRIGNMVSITVEMIWSAHTGTGSASIQGLPFVANTDSTLSVYNNGYATTGTSILSCQVLGGQSNIYLFQTVASTGVTTAAAIDTSVNVICLSGIYFA